MFFFFFFKQKTAYEMRISDWSSDVCSSDLPAHYAPFDAVIMNPPFDRGRDCDHVRHALAFLKPGGVLVAIMSARAEYGEDQRHKALHRMIAGCEAIYFHGRKWIDLRSEESGVGKEGVSKCRLRW